MPPAKKSALGKGLGALIKAPPPPPAVTPGERGGSGTAGSGPAVGKSTAVSSATGGNSSSSLSGTGTGKRSPLPPPPPLGGNHLTDGANVAAANGEQVLQLAVAEIVASPFQPRKRFSDQAITDMMVSIKEHGIIQPLIVRPTTDNKFELIAGERRFRASRQLKLDHVPVIVRDATDREVLEMALIENLQREDLNPIEEAEAYVRLAKEFHLRQEDIAQKVGKSRASVANAMRMMDLESSIRDLVAQGTLSAGHAKAILGIKTNDEQKLIADMVVRQRLNVRDTEQLVSRHLHPNATPSSDKGGGKSKKSKDLPDYLLTIQNHLCSEFSTRVSIRQAGPTGKIEIEYGDDEDLDRILEKMGIQLDDGIDTNLSGD